MAFFFFCENHCSVVQSALSRNCLKMGWKRGQNTTNSNSNNKQRETDNSDTPEVRVAHAPKLQQRLVGLHLRDGVPRHFAAAVVVGHGGGVADTKLSHAVILGEIRRTTAFFVVSPREQPLKACV